MISNNKIAKYDVNGMYVYQYLTDEWWADLIMTNYPEATVMQDISTDVFGFWNKYIMSPLPV